MAQRVAIKGHPKFEEIKQALQQFSNRYSAVKAICYRCTEPQFADQIISGLGSQLHGARWTPKGAFPTVYLCETVETALQEYLARARRLRIPDYRSLPMVMASVKVRVTHLLDITNLEVAAAIRPFLDKEQIHWRAIQNRREAVSQAIGRAIRDICFSGLIVDSQASPGSRNIIIFPKKFRADETLSTPILERMHMK